jgi:hypothetical protein
MKIKDQKFIKFVNPLVALVAIYIVSKNLSSFTDNKVPVSGFQRLLFYPLIFLESLVTGSKLEEDHKILFVLIIGIPLLLIVWIIAFIIIKKILLLTCSIISKFLQKIPLKG